MASTRGTSRSTWCWWCRRRSRTGLSGSCGSKGRRQDGLDRRTVFWRRRTLRTEIIGRKCSLLRVLHRSRSICRGREARATTVCWTCEVDETACRVVVVGCLRALRRRRGSRAGRAVWRRCVATSCRSLARREQRGVRTLEANVSPLEARILLFEFIAVSSLGFVGAFQRADPALLRFKPQRIKRRAARCLRSR